MINLKRRFFSWLYFDTISETLLHLEHVETSGKDPTVLNQMNHSKMEIAYIIEI